MSGLQNSLKIALLLSVFQSMNSQTVSSDSGFKIVSKNQIKHLVIVDDALYFNSFVAPGSESIESKYVNLLENKMYQQSRVWHEDFTNVGVSRSISIHNGKMMKNFCRYKDFDIRCEQTDLDKDIEKIEMYDGNNIQTYKIVNENLIISNNKWAMKATSEYDKKSFLFIDGENSKPIKIDVTQGNKLVTNDTKYGTDWFVSGFYSTGGMADFAVVHSRPGYSSDVLCIYKIYNEKVSEMIYDGDELIPSNQHQFTNKWAVVMPNEDIVVIKERQVQPKFTVTMFSRSGGKHIKMWKVNLTNFLDITAVTEVNNQLLIGGTSKDGGFLGFFNPHIKILDTNTGKVKKEYYIPSKYGTVRSIDRTVMTKKTDPEGKKVSDYMNGDLIITCGYYLGIHDSYIDEKSEGVLIRDYLKPDGTFYNNLFNVLKHSPNVYKIWSPVPAIIFYK